MRKMLLCASPVSGSPASCSADPKATISARNGASTWASYTGLRGLNHAGSLLSRSSSKNANAAGLNPVKAPTRPMLAMISAAATSVEQEFAVAVRAKDRALDDPDHGPVRLHGDPAGDAL